MSPELMEFFLSGSPMYTESARLASNVRFSGAAISRSNLAIVSLQVKGGTWLELAEGSTGFFTLQGRGQESVRSLYGKVRAHCARSRIKYLALRGAPESGRITGSPMSYVVEGALNLLDDVSLEIFHAHSVAHRLRLEGDSAPGPPAGVPSKHRFIYEQAIGAACLAHARSPEMLSRTIRTRGQEQ